MKELIEHITKAIVDNPNCVEIIEKETEYGTEYSLKVDKADVGKIIGKQGRTVSAIRVLLSAAATKQRKRATLKILE